MPLGGDELVRLAKEVLKEDDRAIIPEARVFDRGFLQRDELKKDPLHLREWMLKEMEEERQRKESKQEKLERKTQKRTAKQAKTLEKTEDSLEKEVEIPCCKNHWSRGRKPRAPKNKKTQNVLTNYCEVLTIDDDAMLEESDLDIIEVNPNELVNVKVQEVAEMVVGPEIPAVNGDEISSVNENEISAVVDDDEIIVVNDDEINKAVNEDDDLDMYDNPAGRELSVKVWCKGKLLRKTMQMTDKFSQLYCYIAKENSVEASQVAIYHKGSCVGVDDTPKELKISVVDILDSCIFDTREEIQENLMSIKIQSKDSKVKTALDIHKLGPLSRMMELYAEQKGLPLDKLKFEFDGEKILPHQTPEDLEMESGSCIDVKLL